MKYYLIAGEASGDLHASRLMESLKREDPEAEFRFFGGDLMAAVGGTRVKHYKELAYMGFIPVMMHLRTIMRNMRMCKQDIRQWQPDVVILVDYPGFNLDIAKYVHRWGGPKVYYYIAPKIWAWKEYRIKRIKRDVDELFSILPFEVDFFEGKHHYPIHYVGNPTAEEVKEWLSLEEGGRLKVEGEGLKIALLAGSRKQEIKDNLPAMLRVADEFSDRYEVVVAGAPSIGRDYYAPFLAGHRATVVYSQTYALLHEACAALVTSGTATLETALFGVPQVVCYRLPMAKVYGALRKMLLKVKYVSLVNLVADREVVPELVADTFSEAALKRELSLILPGGAGRDAMLRGYEEVRQRLGNQCAPDEAARLMVKLLKI
ncbi:MAG: lipid-A-disaccharide synthase [Prevotella sp.]|nr:lipid-A-disaccharide synthase [Prevotella sp.]